MNTPNDASQKETRRLPAKTNATAMMLREKYTRRRDAIQRFTNRLEKGNFPDDADLETLRAVGVSEDEIKGLVEKYRKP